MLVSFSARIPPQRARQYSAGVYGKLGTLLDWSVDGYIKTMRNLLEYTQEVLFLLPGPEYHATQPVQKSKPVEGGSQGIEKSDIRS